MALKLLYEQGGIVLFPDMRANLNLKKLRLNPIFFGFEDQEDLTAGCFGAVKGHYVIQALLDSYGEDNIFNRALLPLKDRLRDFLIRHFRLRVNGRKQLLKKEIQVYLPSVLAYDMKDGDNCCKRKIGDIPEGYEAVSGKVLAMWSNRILENWNLYKRELDGKPPAVSQPAAKPDPASSANFRQELDARIQEVVETYENSTCWKLTKPLRMLAKLFGKKA